jgi:uncharacterized Fe-S cluster-containing radical SAM superfamily protein
MYKWRVCPIQGRQLKDVREEDIFHDFRICDTYRGGGGYDQFPKIAMKRLGPWRLEKLRGNLAKQFVVQLYGCHLDCPYCYVTSDGVRGRVRKYTSNQLTMQWFLRAYGKYRCGVFHLMGGSPALYIYHWYKILDILPPHFLFHSDMLLTEKPYPSLRSIARENAIYAINIKGVTSEDHYRNTGKELDWDMFWYNLDRVSHSVIEFYITFTNPDINYLEEFKTKLVERYGEWAHYALRDSFVIDLIEYDALKVKVNDNNIT